MQCEFKKKRKPGFDSIFLKIERDITKLISVHDSILVIILFSFCTLFIHSDMDGCTAINFVKHVKIVFVQVGIVCTA